MIKGCTLFKRKPGMSVEDFQAYWLNEHPKVVCQLPGIRRYVQSHPLPGGYRRGELVFDGLAEVWADDANAFRAMSSSPQYRALIEDEEVFIDRPGMIFLLTEEHVIKDGPVPVDGLKNVEMVHHRPDLSIPEFQAYWRGTHGPLAAQIPVIRRYVQSHVKLSGYNREPKPVCDGLAITWFDSIDSMRESATTEAYARTREDEPNFIDTDGTIPTVITKEHVIVA